MVPRKFRLYFRYSMSVVGILIGSFLLVKEQYFLSMANYFISYVWLSMAREL